MAFSVKDEIKIDVTKLTIDEQLDMCRLLIKAEYAVDRQYRVKAKGSNVTRSYITAGKRGDADV